jgi:HEAT repeat protein
VIEFLSSIELDKQSFWLGFITGAIFIWFLSRLRKYLPRVLVFIKQKYLETREGLISQSELRYRNETLFELQKKHITSSMFSLDEIIIPPRLLAPPIPIDMESETQAENIINLTIPYLPDWPELAAKYKAPTISLPEALSKGANLIVIGQPGSGRTVALAHLASLLLRKEINDQNLTNLLPVYLHAQEIEQTDINNSPIDSILKITSQYLSVLTQQRLSSLLQSSFEKNRAILLIDGMDEVSIPQYQIVQKFINDVLNSYPKIRFVVTSSPENITGLTQSGLIPVALAAWDDAMITAFINKFSQQWRRVIHSNDHHEEDKLEHLMIRSWLESHKYPKGPLELTLRIWSAFAGDILGPDFPANIDAYIRRTISEYPESRDILGQITAQMIIDQKLTIDQDDIEFFLKRKSKYSDMLLDDAKVSFQAELETIEIESANEEPSRGLKIQSLLQAVKRTGLLLSHDDRVYKFSHPIIAGYLAGNAIARMQDVSFLLEQSDWVGKNLIIAYYLHFNEGGENIIDKYIDWDKDDFIHKKILIAARWLKNGKSNSSWRKKLMRYMAVNMQDESITLTLSSRFLSALAMTNDPHVGPLFRQLLSSEDANTRQLAALGCGLIRDEKSVTELAKLINDIIPAVSRSACLALVAIGDKNALETVATVLIQGSEMVQRYAAEALANHTEEGHPALRDGSKMDDLLIRRAVIFGLARINEPWADEILENLQLEDQQWLVRNAAIQALEERNRPKPYLPTPSGPLTDMTWLIEFASKLGIGVAPGKPAVDLLIRALRDGDEELRLAALNYLQVNGIEEVIPIIVNVYRGSLGEVREAAFNTLWHLSASGYEINIQS